MKRKYRVTVGTKTFTVEVEETEDGRIGIVPPSPFPETTNRAKSEKKNETAENGVAAENIQGTVIKAPMLGTVRSIKVKVGDIVRPKDVLLTLEAMKMEDEICASKTGAIRRILIAEGQVVEQNDPMLIIDEKEIP